MSAESKGVETTVSRLWKLSGGNAWEPPNPMHPNVVALIEGGWLRRVDGRCGFEAFKDSMVTWTDAARVSLTSSAPCLNCSPPCGLCPRDLASQPSGVGA